MTVIDINRWEAVEDYFSAIEFHQIGRPPTKEECLSTVLAEMELWKC